MSPTTRRSLVIPALLAVQCASIAGAGLVPAPSQELAKSRNRVVVAEVRAKMPPEHVRFSVREVLSGESPEVVTVRLRPAAFAEVCLGETYVLGYSTLRKNPLLRDVWEEDPDGPKAVRLPLAEDALLTDTAEVRRLLAAAGPQAQPADPARLLADLLTQLQRPHGRTRRMAIFELFARPDLRAAIGAAELEVLEGAARSRKLAPEERDYLLKTWLLLPEARRGTGMVMASRGILDAFGPEVDLTSTVPTLLHTAIMVLERAGGPADLPRLARHLRSTNPSVAEKAHKTMDALDPAAALAAARRALAGDELHAQTRKLLEPYVQP